MQHFSQIAPRVCTLVLFILISNFVFIYYSENLNKLITSVHLFMETAPLGEFSSRLTILDAFSADMSNRGNDIICIQ